VIAKVLDWLGFGSHGHGQHDHDQDHAHGHTHGVMDPTIATTARGIWAIKWSFLILAGHFGVPISRTSLSIEMVFGAAMERPFSCERNAMLRLCASWGDRGPHR
jgi:hypothetical protein